MASAECAGRLRKWIALGFLAALLGLPACTGINRLPAKKVIVGRSVTVGLLPGIVDIRDVVVNQSVSRVASIRNGVALYLTKDYAAVFELDDMRNRAYFRFPVVASGTLVGDASRLLLFVKRDANDKKYSLVEINLSPSHQRDTGIRAGSPRGFVGGVASYANTVAWSLGNDLSAKMYLANLSEPMAPSTVQSPTGLGAHDPHFSADGEKLAYIIRRQGLFKGPNMVKSEIWVTDLSNGHYRPVVKSEQSPEARSEGPLSLAWTPKGDFIAYLETRDTVERSARLALVNSISGVAQPITGWSDDYSSVIGWSDSGKYLYYVAQKRVGRARVRHLIEKIRVVVE